MVADMDTSAPSPKALLVAQEISFAKVLAGNDKVTRDRALKKLRKWLTAMSGPKQEFTEDDFLRIWKGLFYCMWMSDKFLVQEELAENLSKLVHCFVKRPEKCFIFMKCFFKTICVEWVGIDQYRIDKFSLLIRRFFRQSLVFCKNQNWEAEDIKQINTILSDTILALTAPVGLTLHFIEIYPEELAKVGGSDLPGHVVTIFLEPFISLLVHQTDGRVKNQINELFKHLIKQTDVGIKYEEKFEAWKQAGFPGGDISLMKAIRKRKKHGKTNKDEDDEEDDKDDEVKNADLDPRAGHVDVVLPQVKLDAPSIISVLQTYQSNSSASLKAKKSIALLIKNFSFLQRGQYPFTMNKIEIVEEKKKKKSAVLAAAKRLIKFEEELKNPRRSKKKKRREHVEREVNGSSSDKNGNTSENDEEEEEETEDSGSEIEEPIDTPTKIKEKVVLINKKEPAELKETPIKPKNQLKQCKSVSPSTHSLKAENKIKSVDVCNVETNKPRQVEHLPKRKSFLESFEVEEISVADTPTKKQKLSSDWCIEDIDMKSPEYRKIITPKIIKIEKKIKVDPWKEPLQDGEVEIIIPVKKTPVELTKTLPTFFQNAQKKALGSQKSSVKKTPEKPINRSANREGRRISFALNKNIEHEDLSYMTEVKRSPAIPYDSNKKPSHSALKAGLLPSPINPFYKATKNKDFIRI